MTPAALLLHGFTHTGSSWDPVVAALGERYRVVAPDVRGQEPAADALPLRPLRTKGDTWRLPKPLPRRGFINPL